MKDKKKILDWALEYYQLGWSIIPIIAGTKKAAVKWEKYQTERPSQDQLRKWFANGKYKSLAVVCGAVSGGLAVLDLDSERRCHWWRNSQPELAKTLPTVKTKKGLHIHLRSEPFGKRNGDEVDLLCEGAYAILPPSPDKEWLIPLNGELPLLKPFGWGLEQFGIKKTTIFSNNTKKFTEEREEIEDTEEIEEKEEKRVSVSYESLDKGLKKRVDFAIAQTLPDKRGYRNFSIFRFCRWLKGMSEFVKLDAKAVKNLCREWHRCALSKIGTKPFDETWADFAYGWDRVKYPKGDGMLKLAVENALKAQVPVDAEKEYESPETQLLVRVCYELQKLKGTEMFWLSCYDAANILGISHTNANKRIQMLVTDGILEMIEKNTTRKATRFRYIANLL